MRLLIPRDYCHRVLMAGQDFREFLEQILLWTKRTIQWNQDQMDKLEIMDQWGLQDDLALKVPLEIMGHQVVQDYQATKVNVVLKDQGKIIQPVQKC